MIHRAAPHDLDELTTVVRDAVKSLSTRDVDALVTHPAAVRSALAVAAKAISVESDREASPIEMIGSGQAPRRVDSTEAKVRLDARTRQSRTEELLTSDEFAARAGLKTRQTVHDWLKKRCIIGWSGTKRGYIFPAGQLDERGRLPEGLERVMSFFEDDYTAWVWLTTPFSSLEGETPLALLRKGEVDCVVAAAVGDTQGDFA